jgi:hypothetical protein
MPGDDLPQVELFSREWLALAREFLELQVAAAGDRLDGVTFSVCEVLTNPPSHLALPGTDTVSWHVIFLGPTVDVGFGEIDATFKNVGDYEGTRPIAKTVYGDRPDVLEERRKKRAEAGLPDVPEVLQPMMIAVHDHLARRTL